MLLIRRLGNIVTWALLLTSAVVAIDWILSVFFLGASVELDRAVSLVLAYALIWTAGGVLSTIVLSVFGANAATARARAVMLSGSLLYLVGVPLNVLWLPASTSPLAIAVNSALLVLAGFLFLRVRHWSGRVRLSPRWLAVPGGALAILLVAQALLSPPEQRELMDRVSPEPRSVLLVVVDTLRADHTSLHGYHRETTPNLDRFARDGLVFEKVAATSSWTKPSMASILTGLPPIVHAAESKWAPLPSTATTLAELFRWRGYRTSVFSDNPFMSSGFGLAQGYEVVDSRATQSGLERLRLSHRTLLGRVLEESVVEHLGILGRRTRKEVGAKALNARFLAWLDGLSSEEAFFAHVHYMEPHNPYDPPREWKTKFTSTPIERTNLKSVDCGLAPFRIGQEPEEGQQSGLIDQYDAEIAWWDSCFGRLLEELAKRNRLRNTLICVTSDHGEGFFEHGTWLHGNSLHQELIHVPLVLRGPGIDPARATHSVSQLALPSTLVSLAGFLPPASMRDETVPLLPVPTEDRRTHSFVEWEDVTAFGATMGEEKWILSIRGSDERLQRYDLGRDPAEGSPDPSGPEDLAARIRDQLLRWGESLARRALDSEDIERSPDLDNMLKGLGYLR